MTLRALLSRGRERRSLTGAFLFALLGVALLIGWVFWPNAFFRAYWLALMFWAQLSIGAMIVLLLQYVTGGKWGRAGAPILRTVASGIYLLGPLFLPALFALPHLFSWTEIKPGVSTQVLVNKQVWLNQPAFIVRTLFYVFAFTAFTAIWSRVNRPEAKWGGPFLALSIVLISFCSADWMMSLQPTFYSSLYPFLYFSGAMVSTFAMLSGTTAWLQKERVHAFQPDLLLANGKLFFASVLFWGYIVFAQFIIIWTGNLPDEAEWYLVRATPSVLPLTLIILALHFAVPFCLLLSHQRKKDPGQIFLIASGVMAVHLLEIFWLMRPMPGHGLRVSPFDFLMPLLIGACWLWFILTPARVAGILTHPELHE